MTRAPNVTPQQTAGMVSATTCICLYFVTIYHWYIVSDFLAVNLVSYTKNIIQHHKMHNNPAGELTVLS